MKDVILILSTRGGGMNIRKKLEKYIKSVYAYLSKFNKFNRVAYYLEYLNIKEFNLVSLIFISLVIFIISNIFFINKIKIFSSSLIISIILSFIPYAIIKNIYIRKRQKIIEIFPTYIINLKNYTQTSNDIIIAMKNTVPPDIIEPYIKNFNNLIRNGVSASDAFDRLSNKINIKRIREFFISCGYCYINGGNFNRLLEKYAKALNTVNMQREKENQENFSTKIVMVIIIFINLYMVFGFCFSNEQYKQIIINSFVGRSLINMNLISYVIIFLFSNKLEEMGD